MDELKENDVIQIAPDARCHPDLQGRLAFVTEVKSFGCQAGVPYPEGVAYVRLEHAGFTRIGPAPYGGLVG